MTTSNNLLTVSVNSNVVFTSFATQTNGALWQLQGTLAMDGSSNLTTAFSLTGNGVGGAAFATVSNFAAGTARIVIGESTVGDTNLTITSVQIAGQQGVAGVLPFYSWPPSFISVTAYTPVTTTATTFGYGAGLLAGDTNYLYVSVATNLWRRISIPTNTW